MLNERQKALYKHLKGCKSWITQEGIARALNEHYDLKSIPKGANFHDSSLRIKITNDIRAINSDEDTAAIIISGPLGVKLANKEEFERYIRNEIEALKQKSIRIKKKLKKAAKDNQAVIDDNGYISVIKVFESEDESNEE